ncbi:MAG: MBL fold metallo-hydrolase [Candidatus Moduliflexus flocculans]|nr:MBL fold metallo-hydrolase [Candidatus Moduliflexus flocculans]
MGALSGEPSGEGLAGPGPCATRSILRCWGTRGSLPAARPSTNRYGGNTPCVEVRVEGRLFIFDAGSRIRTLGESLRREKGRTEADVFFTHYHRDHIHGFPFFGSLAYAPQNLFRVWGERRGRTSVKDILAGQMAMPYFPVPLSAMRARIEVRDVGPGQTLELGPATNRTQALNHPGKALSYRIEHGGHAIVYATDTEHGARLDERLVRQRGRGGHPDLRRGLHPDHEIRHGRKGWGTPPGARRPRWRGRPGCARCCCSTTSRNRQR